MKRFAAAAVLILTPGAAAATEALSCQDEAQEAYIEINMGQAAVEVPSWVRIGIGDETWSSLGPDLADGATPIAIAQFFADDRHVSLDLADEGQGAIVASLRLLRVAEGDDYIQAGYLAFPGRGAYAVICLG